MQYFLLSLYVEMYLNIMNSNNMSINLVVNTVKVKLIFFKWLSHLSFEYVFLINRMITQTL